MALTEHAEQTSEQKDSVAIETERLLSDVYCKPNNHSSHELESCISKTQEIVSTDRMC